MLGLVGIPEPRRRADAYPHEFSGGMRQRVMIAMALCNDPKLLIADEPTTALDVTVQAQILDLMRRLQDELDTAIVMITHDLGVVAEVTDDIAVMYAGRIVEKADKETIFAAPEHPYTWGLLKSIPALDTPRGEELVPDPGPPAVAHHAALRVLLPPALPVRAPGPHQGRSAHRGRAGRSPPRRGVPAGLGDAQEALGLPAGGRRARGRAPPRRERGAGGLMAGQPLIQVRDLKKHFPISKGIIRSKQVGAVRAVDGVSFDVLEGETLGLVGESGCGKSTTARLITRLLDPTEGTISYDGRDIATLSRRELKPLRRDMQMVFQDPYSSLNPRKTVGTIISEPFVIHGVEDDERKRKLRVQELMEQVGLNPEHYNRLPHEFSGGQRQRIGVARAIALKPKLVVADEPVSALDVSIQAQILNLLRQLQRDLGLTIVFIAHDLSVVRHMCDRIAVMYLGKIVELASADELYSHPRHPYTGALLSAVPVPDPRLARTKVRQVLGGDVPSPADPPRACRFHTRCPKVVLGKCDVDDPALDAKEGGNLAACHFPLSDREVAAQVPTAAA
jgi:oligopeptide/dipeptide ABC transporter ATP-binding protein